MYLGGRRCTELGGGSRVKSDGSKMGFRACPCGKYYKLMLLKTQFDQFPPKVSNRWFFHNVICFIPASCINLVLFSFVRLVLLHVDQAITWVGLLPSRRSSIGLLQNLIETEKKKTSICRDGNHKSKMY